MQIITIAILTAAMLTATIAMTMTTSAAASPVCSSKGACATTSSNGNTEATTTTGSKDAGHCGTAFHASCVHILSPSPKGAGTTGTNPSVCGGNAFAVDSRHGLVCAG